MTAPLTKEEAALGFVIVPAKVHWISDGHEPDVLDLAYVGSLYVGEVRQWSEEAGRRHGGKRYRAWLQSCEDGDELGWFGTLNEAKFAVEHAAMEAIASPPPEEARKRKKPPHAEAQDGS